jgi:3-hydroxyacyl-CoA dehydrogenase / 3-hydroxy-2-methylbutyryl-CoA dehydrogenase
VAVSEVLRWSEELKVNIAAVICCAGILGPAKVRTKSQYVPTTHSRSQG